MTYLWSCAVGGAFSVWWEDLSYTFYKCFIREDRYRLILGGIGVTVKVALLAAALGLVIGFLIAICNLSRHKWLNRFGKVYTDVIRGTPSVTQLMIIYFVVFASVHWPKWLIAAIAFSINSGAYVSEIIRGGLMAVDSGQMEAGRSLGMNYTDTMRFIIVPQAVKAILPALGNEFIMLLKDTSLISVIGGKELLYAARGIVSRTYEAMYPFLGTAAIYLVLVMIFTWLLGKFERRLRQSDRR